MGSQTDFEWQKKIIHEVDTASLNEPWSFDDGVAVISRSMTSPLRDEYGQGQINSLRGPRALKNVVGCGCELDAFFLYAMPKCLFKSHSFFSS
jgi:hypothetical protein